MTAKKRLQLLKEAKELGMKSIEIDGVKYELSEQKTAQPVQELSEDQVKSLFSDTKVLDEMSDDEVLYWATPYYDQLQHEKKLQDEQRKLKKDLTNGQL